MGRKGTVNAKEVGKAKGDGKPRAVKAVGGNPLPSPKGSHGPTPNGKHGLPPMSLFQKSQRLPYVSVV